MIYKLFVYNRAQAAIYEMEMKSELRHGRWENSLPEDHWRAPTEAVVLVRPAKVGKNWHHTRGYRFNEPDLLEMHQEQTIRFIKVALAFPDVTIDALAHHQWEFADEWYPEKDLAYRPEHLEKKQMNRAAMLGTLGTHDMKTLEAEIARVSYTFENLKQDAKDLNSCFKAFAE